MKNLAPHWRVRLICLGLGIITFLLYLPSVHHEFLVYDDQQYVTENTHVEPGITKAGLVWAFGFHASNWHPLTWISHMLDCQFYGLKPWGHHLTNVLLHAANAMLVFLALCQLTRAVGRSALVALLFAVHPLHVESVAWVAERKDVLCAFFVLLTLLAYTRYAQSVKRPDGKPLLSYLTSLLLFALALMSKPMSVTLPFVFLLLDYWPLNRLSTASNKLSSAFRLGLEKAPFLIMAAVACLLTISAQRKGFSVVSVAGLPVSHPLGHIVVSYAHYLFELAAPIGLAVHYPYEKNIPAREIIFSLVVLFSICGLVLRFATRKPYLPVGWLWYLGTLVPVIGFVQVGDQAWADRYMYLPSIGIFLLVVWGGCEFLQSAAGKMRAAGPGRKSRFPELFAWGGVTMITLVLMFLTHRQLSYWRNTWTLFDHTARVTHRNARAVTVLGSLLAQENKLAEAQVYYHRALTWNPDFPEAHFYLGNALAREGRLDEAIAEYRHAIWFPPIQESALIFLGDALGKQNKPQEAVIQYQAALRVNGNSAVSHNNLAKALQALGDLDGAITHYGAALEINPQLPQAHNNLGVLLLQKGQFSEGAAQLEKALRLNPSDPETEYNLGLALNQQGKWTEAIEHFSATVGKKIEDPNAHYQFGLALANTGKTREALGHLARALILKQDFPEALDQISWILATSPQAEFRNGAEAVRMAESACSLTGNQRPRMLMTLAVSYAEAGRFPEAISTIEKAKALAETTKNQGLAAKCQTLVEVFRSDRAYREEPK